MKKELSFFGKQLKKIMYEKNITQQELADKLNIKRSMISQWITKSGNPRLSTIRKIASALKVPTNYFLEDSLSSNKNIKDTGKDINVELIMKLIQENNERINLELSILKEKIKTLEKRK